MMNKKLLWLVGVLIVGLAALVFVFTRPGTAQTAPEQSEVSMDPQKLMIPRWFLIELTLDGQIISLPGKEMSLQFREDGQAGGESSCNSFGSPFEAGADGSIRFGPVWATKMMCEEGMQQETALFQALEKVQRFQVSDGKLTLSSADGQTVLVYKMPPK